jgi:2-iminobutanoate/2-iminopropanoate deaminase
MKTPRRSVLKRLLAIMAGLTGLGLATRANANNKTEKVVSGVTNFQDVPLFSASTRFGNLLFLSGRGQRLEGDIKVHTDNVLKLLEAELIKVGSSMEKVLKVTVFLDKIEDYYGMNEIYKGRFGPNPPARTTVAVPNGLPPADNLIQMDCIAYI